MANLKEIFDQIGADPTNFAGPTRASQVVSSSSLAQEQERKRRAALLLAQLGQAPVVSGGNATGMYTGIDSGFRAGNPQFDGGPGLGDLIGEGFKGLLKVVDTGRRGVASFSKELIDAWSASDAARWLGSGGNVPDWLITQRTKEEYDKMLEDAGATGGFEWGDIGKNYDENMSFGKMMNDYNQQGSSWKNRIIGFAGDVASDPLTYVALGGKTVAKEGADAVVQAVEHGTREGVSKALVDAAEKAGLQGDEAVQRLVAQAGRQGRGALTKKSLERLGIDAAKAEQLGLPGLSREFMGFNIKGSGAVADVIENAKGTIKESLGGSAAARYGRALRYPTNMGKKALIDVVRGGEHSAKDVFEAVQTLAVRQEAKVAGKKWGTQLANAVKQELGAEVRGMGRAERRDFTHMLERVAAGDVEKFAAGSAEEQLAAKARTFLRETGQKLKDMGVLHADVDLEAAYVPHMLSDAARSSNNKEIRQWAKQFGEMKGFQKERLLKPGLDADGKPITFMGEVIKEGTIQEINDISLRKAGIKFLEDDFTNILPAYIGQTEQAVMDKALAQGLIDRGVASSQKALHSLDDAERFTLDVLKGQREAALEKQKVVLSDGMQVRYDQIDAARTELHGQRKALNTEIEKLRVSQAENARNLTLWNQRVATLEQELPHIEEQIGFFRKQAARLRGNERKAALRKVAKAEAALEVKTTEYQTLKARIARLPKGDAENVVMRPGEAVAANAAVGDVATQLGTLQNQLRNIQADADRLLQAQSPLGTREVPYEQALADAQKYDDWARKALEKNKANIVNGEMDKVSIEGKLSIAEDELQGINNTIAAAGQKGRRRTKASGANAALVRDHAQQVIDAAKASLEVDNPTLARLMDLEVKGAIYDMKSVDLADQVSLFDDMIKVMEDPKFGSVIKYQVDQGFAALNQTAHQIPEWLDDALKLQGRMLDPAFMPGLRKALRQVNNLWKGWATMRPGFIVRNAYSSTFGFYLEAGNFKAVSRALKDFEGFYRIFKADPTNYMERAVEKYGIETAERLDKAMGVMAGSGGGLAHSEIASNVFRGKNINPFSTNFVGIRATRSANESVEAVIRGAHAYDVLLRSSDDVNIALDTIEKWHFNYGETTAFDRAAKSVIPFWTFFSRNTALQAHVWTHHLPELNRSYMNLQRNAQLGQPEDENVPGYITAGMPIPLSVNPDGVSRYANLDVGPTQFARDMQNLASPKKFIGGSMGFAPPIGMGMQALAGESLFTGAPNDRMVNAGPLWGPVANTLGFGEQTGSGGTAITQFQRDALGGLLPGVSTGNRLADTSKQSFWWNLAAYGGLSTSQVTPDQRAAQQYRRRQALKAEAAKREMLARL